ncbi:MAG TPA: translocation/assembly module TamB domain-containing protein [Rhizomicrobium sp.]|nr:translocation/assembly module TamB domain-containing protein [Rhizomicrobium sp.]
MSTRAKSWMIRAAVAAGVIAIVFVTLFLVGTGTAPGRQVVAGLISRLTGGTVVVQGLDGDLPNRVRAQSVELHDANGVWLRIDGLSLDWRALSALRGPIAIDRVNAAHVQVFRRPLPGSGESSDTAIVANGIAIARIDVAAPVLGHSGAFSVNGSFAYSTIHDAKADLEISQLDGDGRYAIHGAIANDIVTGNADVSETRQGFAGGLLGLTTLGPMKLSARGEAQGTHNTIALHVLAGVLTARASGAIDLAARNLNLTFDAASPAMQPAPGVAWNSLSARGTLSGSFDAPQIDSRLHLDALLAQGFKASSVDLTMKASAGTGQVEGSIQQLIVPGPHPSLFAANPVVLQAGVDFQSVRRPVIFKVSHPLLDVSGTADTREALTGSATVTIPSLAPIASLEGVDVSGSAVVNLKLTQQDDAMGVTIDARADTRGAALLDRLLGRKATAYATIALKDGALDALNATLSGARIVAHASGTSPAGLPAYRWDVALNDLGALTPALKGAFQLGGTVTGKGDAARLYASGSGLVGPRTHPVQRVSVELSALGLPSPRSGAFTLSGAFDGAPVDIAGTIAREQGNYHVKVPKGAWKSAHLDGDLVVAANGTPVAGQAALRWGQIGDVAPFIGKKVGGSLTAGLTLVSKGRNHDAHITASGERLVFEGNQIGRLVLSGIVSNPLAGPGFALKAGATGYAVAGAQGDGTIEVNGPMNQLGVHVSSQGVYSNAPFSLAASAAVDAVKNRTVVQTLTGAWHDKPFALARPATIDFVNGLAVHDLAASFAGAHATAEGRISPKLALNTTFENITPDLIRLFAQQLAIEGVLSGNAHLTGTLAAPTGTFELTGRDLHATGVSQRAVPYGVLDAQGTLRGRSATISASFTAGSTVDLTLAGDVPLEHGGAMNVHAKGAADLALLNTYASVTGQSVAGKVALDLIFSGTLAAPRATGSARLSDGEIRDLARGFRLRNITADVEANGTVLRLASLTASARRGTITGSGTIDLGAPGMPVNVVIQAKNAEPIVSDTLTAAFDMDMRLTGTLAQALTLSGKIAVLSGEINLPERFPPSVATLHVRRRGAPPPPPPSPASAIALDLALDVPDHIYVRGRGLDAELNGNLKISGTTSAPLVAGALSMRRGTLSVAGETLEIQSGRVSFDGNSLRNRLDPTLDFTAQTTSGGVTATLKLTGYASAPQIQLSSSPPLPQDEVLSRLLFQTSVKSLSAFQIAEVAQAVASLTGIGGGFNPVGTLRKNLGLDRLAIGSDTTASGASAGTTIEAGRYVGRGFYVGARQNLSGGTRAIVQYDITKNLKLQATVSSGVTATTGTPSTPQNDTGSNVGVLYTFDY